MVCLKDFKMPETCEKCTLESYCSLWADARRMSDDGKKAKIRHPDCPLIEIPPHGRLIDADAVQDEWYRLNFDRKITDGTLAYWNMQLSKAPTIIPAEEGE